ncbi:hypothetical protein [Pigmentiphaga litoralis]|nr:hypothetical protein [Pigmentiphaga litoralis]
MQIRAMTLADHDAVAASWQAKTFGRHRRDIHRYLFTTPGDVNA